MSKSPYSLKEDIYHVLTTGEGYTKEIAEWVGADIALSLQRQLTGRSSRGSRKTLRVSSLGTPCERKLWYTINSTLDPEPLPANTLNKFIFGDLTESHILGLAKASGHSVEGLQDFVDVCGINGSRDCIIDGMLFDVKSASSRAFEKFKHGRLREDDPFGYISQLSSYLYGSQSDPLLKHKTKAGFLAFDKQFGHIAVDIYDLTPELESKEEEVQRKKDLVKKKDPPDRIENAEVPHNKSGNMKLGTNCSYCDFKKECFPHLRKFVYSNGPVYMTKVVKPPKDIWEEEDF